MEKKFINSVFTDRFNDTTAIKQKLPNVINFALHVHTNSSKMTKQIESAKNFCHLQYFQLLINETTKWLQLNPDINSKDDDLNTVLGSPAHNKTSCQQLFRFDWHVALFIACVLLWRPAELWHRNNVFFFFKWLRNYYVPNVMCNYSRCCY